MIKLVLIKYDLIQKASSSLEDSIRNKKWSMSNTKQGFLDGLVECSNSGKKNIKRNLQFAKWGFERATRNCEYGKMAYWESFISGFEVMMSEIEKHNKTTI